jgi:hypothetical protein
MHLHQLMGWSGPMTERQYVTWMAWLDLELNNPSRADWYSMMVARATGAKNVEPIKFAKSKPASDEEQLVWAKQRAIARGGGKVIRVTKAADGDGSARS